MYDKNGWWVLSVWPVFFWTMIEWCSCLPRMCPSWPSTAIAIFSCSQGKEMLERATEHTFETNLGPRIFMSSDTTQSWDVGTSKIKLPEVLNKCLTRPRKGKNPYWVDVNSEGSTNRYCRKHWASWSLMMSNQTVDEHTKSRKSVSLDQTTLKWKSYMKQNSNVVFFGGNPRSIFALHGC